MTREQRLVLCGALLAAGAVLLMLVLLGLGQH